MEPVMDIELFTPNVAVAACNRLPAGTTYTYSAQTVNCVVTTSDTIFTAGTSGCTHEVDPNGSDTYRFITYNNQLYFAWIGPNGSASSGSKKGGSGSGEDSNMSLLKSILKAGGIGSVQVGGSQVWHAGPANATLTQLYSHSF